MKKGCKKYLITAGPTREALDPVRFLTNHSTGKMGYAIAAELARRGAEVTLVSGPVALGTPEGVTRVDVISAEDMYDVCTKIWPQMDGAVMCAAVADYTPVEVSRGKIKKSTSENITLELRPTRDIAAELGRTKRAGQTLVGFALETDNEEANALEKMRRKNLDCIVLNSLRELGAGFGGDTNRITIFERTGRQRAAASRQEGCRISECSVVDDHFSVTRTSFPLETKTSAAAHIADRL